MTDAGTAISGAQRPRWRAAAMVAALLAILAIPAAAQDDDDWAEWTYRWGQLTIVLRTNAGVYSPALQALGMDSSVGAEATRPAKLMELARFFFVMTSAPREDHTFEFIEPLARKWAPDIRCQFWPP